MCVLGMCVEEKRIGRMKRISISGVSSFTICASPEILLI
jgi:hypothetical protein